MGVYRWLAGAVLGRQFEFHTDQRIAPTSRVRRMPPCYSAMGLKEESSKLGMFSLCTGALNQTMRQ
jgi:hypothetical protein